MQEGKFSRTAHRVATRRAAHQLLDQPIVLDDPLALRIIGSEAAAELRSNPKENHSFARAFRAFMVARSRYAEDELAQAYLRGVRQYVVLGAGLDSSVLTFGACHKLTQGCKPKLDPTSARPEFRFTPIETAEAVDSAVGCQLSQRVFSVGCGCSHRNADSDYPAGSRAASRRASP